MLWCGRTTIRSVGPLASRQRRNRTRRGALSVHLVATPNADTGADAADHAADAVRSMIEAALADDEIPPQDAAAGIQGPPAKPDTVITETVTGVGVLLDYLKLEMRYNARGVRIEARRSDWPGAPARRWAGQWGRDVGPDGWVELSDEMEAQLYNVSREFFNFSTPAGWPVRAVWSERSLRAAIMGAYEGKVVDPFAQWLEKLPAWDGVERMGELWITPLLMPDTELNREAGGRFLVGAVRRAFEAGSVHDWIPVLVGPQGLGKSSMLKALLPYSEWLSDSVSLDDDRKERIEGAGLAVIVEFSEMAGLSKADARAFKTSLSVPTDRVRLPWGRHSVPIPRRWVGVGTANRGMDGVLPYDESGSRRYVVMESTYNGPDNSLAPIAAAARAWVTEHRLQLWAEALATYRAAEAANDGGANLIPGHLREVQEAAAAGHHYGQRDDLADAVEALAVFGERKQHGDTLIELLLEAKLVKDTPDARAGPPLAATIRAISPIRWVVKGKDYGPWCPWDAMVSTASAPPPAVPCCSHPPDEHDAEGRCIHAECDCLSEDAPTGTPTGGQPRTAGATAPKPITAQLDRAIALLNTELETLVWGTSAAAQKKDHPEGRIRTRLQDIRDVEPDRVLAGSALNPAALVKSFEETFAHAEFATLPVTDWVAYLQDIRLEVQAQRMKIASDLKQSEQAAVPAVLRRRLQPSLQLHGGMA